MSPAETVGLLPYSIAISSSLVLVITLVQTKLQKPSPAAAPLLEIALWALLPASIVASGLALFKPVRRPVPMLSERFSLRGIKSYLLAVQLGSVLLCVPVFLLIWRMPYEGMTWFGYGFQNNRWLFALYWLVVATFLVFPPLFARLLEAVPLRSLLRSGFHEPAEKPGGRERHGWFRAVKNTVLALALACYFAGPPWHLDVHHRPIDFHEQVHLGPLQAISQGYLPYVGPASTQYGPGSQMVTFLFMKLSRHFDVVGFREATAFIHFITVIIFCLVAFLLLDSWAGLVVLLLGLAYSPLSFFSWEADGTLGGFYGWGNGFRYLGVLVVVPLLGMLVTSRWKARFPAWPTIALGVVWGLFSWLSQENLSTTLAAGMLLWILLWLSETALLADMGRVSLNMLGGFAAFWALLLAYYVAHGAAREFVHDYFLVPSAVVAGYSNTYWSSGPTDPQINAFCFTAPFVIAVGICTLWDLPRLRLRRGLDVHQRRLVAFLCVLAASYPASLFRSDSSHLVNTLIALPFVLFLAVQDLPDWIATQPLNRWALRILLIAVSFYLFPLRPFFADFEQSVFLGPRSRFIHRSAPDGPAPDNRMPFRRATRYLSDEPVAAASLGNIPMRQFLEYLSGLQVLVGSRKTYIQGFPGGAAAFPYFMMDLTPAPHLVDRDMLMINSTVLEEAVGYFRQHVRECEAVITADLAAPEVQIFRQAYPAATVVSRPLGDHPVYLLLAPGKSSFTHE